MFILENYRKRYPYVLLGEKQQTATGFSNTILLYRVTGKRYVFEGSAKELCNARDLVSKFHPLDVRVIAFIAGVEEIIGVKEEQRKQQFELLKQHIFQDSSN